MILVQKNRLKLTSHEGELVTAMAYHAARMYNVGLYSVRQFYFNNGKYLPYHLNYHECKDSEHYKLLLTDTSQQILKIIERDMKSFFRLNQLRKDGKYSAKVRLPHYKKPESLSMITVQGRSARIRDGYVCVGFSKAFKERYQPLIKELKFKLPTNVKVDKLQELRIIPRFGGQEWDIEFVYKKEVEPQLLDQDNYLSLDLGLDNLATAFDSTSGASFIVCGRYIKSINRWYNKEKARLQSVKDKQGYTHQTKRMVRLERKREFRINDFFNRTVKYITDYCLEHNVGSIVIGNFANIKQGINHGKRNNQNFVQIPYGKLRQKLASKCEQFGIEVHSTEESYTSKTSFLDRELLQKHSSYLGRRVKRGLFKTAKGILVNADSQAAAQILIKHLLKSKPNLVDSVYERGSSGRVSRPVRVDPSKPPRFSRG